MVVINRKHPMLKRGHTIFRVQFRTQCLLNPSTLDTDLPVLNPALVLSIYSKKDRPGITRMRIPFWQRSENGFTLCTGLIAQMVDG